MHESESNESLLARLQKLEESLLDFTTRSVENADSLLADDFIEIGSSGRTYSRLDVLHALREQAPAPRSASRFHLRRLTRDTVLLTFRTHCPSTSPTDSVRASLWQCRNQRWVLVFHQGTPIADDA